MPNQLMQHSSPSPWIQTLKHYQNDLLNHVMKHMLRYWYIRIRITFMDSFQWFISLKLIVKLTNMWHNTVTLFLCSYFYFYSRYLTDQILNPHFLVAFVLAVQDSPSPQREIRCLLFTEHQEKLSSMISRWFTNQKRVLKIVCTYTCIPCTADNKTLLWIREIEKGKRK
jgi:hypothetical protein